jgi:vacuolar-type H+-ATPase subunit E/Vma4
LVDKAKEKAKDIADWTKDEANYIKEKSNQRRHYL